jgi:Tol biopolymer transport system component/DNA-binding winged helix-turn-helix (wHTH) protein
MLEKRNVPLVVRFGPFTLDGRTGELRNGQIRLKIPDQSISILQALLERPGELVTREALRDRLWGPDTFVDYEAGLNAAVRRLREALNDSADTPRYVETLPRRGYRFIGQIEGTSTADVSISATPKRAGIGRVGRVAIGSAALVLIGVGVWAALPWRVGAPATASSARPLPITSFPGLELHPAISPDGKFVAFTWEGEAEDNFDIYVRSIDGSFQRRLTTDAADDYEPAWSPDGLRIAFVRALNGAREIVVLPSFGGGEQPLFKARSEGAAWRGAWSFGLSWTPDGKHLVFGDETDSTSTPAIYVYSFEDGKRRQLTRPPANFGDIHPVVSPDARYLAFVRLRLNPLGTGGGRVFLQKLEQLQATGEPDPLTSGHNAAAFDWTRDSRSVIYDGGHIEPGLWSVGVAGGAPEPAFPHIRAARPSIARAGTVMVYQNTLIESNIWELRTPSSPNSQAETFRVVASTSADTDMQLSADGTRIAFNSRRSGHSELWVSNRDGSEARRLTNFESGRVGSPFWSADGKWIAFDATRPGGGWNLYVVAADGGPSVRPLTSDSFNNVRPSWSRDGRWIFFGSDRTGDWQIWKMPFAGGTPEKITRGGGVEAIASPDGRHLYYAKRATEGIWQVPTDGGPEVQLIDRGREMAFDVADTGIFMIDASAKPQATIDMYSFAARQLVPVARLPAGRRVAGVTYFTVTRDGHAMLYMQFDSWMSDIEMLPGIR